MNLTVGPLPPAVYWRRRALVAGGLLVAILLLVYSCGGSSGAGAGSRHAGATSSPTRTPAPALSELRPQTGAPPSSADPGGSGSGGGSGDASSAPAGTASPPAGTADETCTDAEILLTPAVNRITGGTLPYELTLKIKNASTRSCRRDVGSGPQELHIAQNGQTLWSSDSCQGGPGQSNVVTFGAGIEDTFRIGWDGTAGNACTGGRPLAPGTYQVIAKLDTKVSTPVNFTIAGK
jgi:hypothetical protein